MALAHDNFPLALDSDLDNAIATWLDHLVADRAYSEKTHEAYARDLQQFFHFLKRHRGHPPCLGDIPRLTIKDFRAFLSARRKEGVSGRSLARTLSRLARLLPLDGTRRPRPQPRRARRRPPQDPPRHSKTTHGCESRRPCRPGRPRPEGAVDRSARHRPHPLYGAGLRISEALALRASEAPTPHRDVVRILGKGGKERLVPILPVAIEAIQTYQAQCPFTLSPDGPLFLGARGGPLSPRIIQLAVARLRQSLGLPDTCDAARLAPFFRNPPPLRWRRSAPDLGTPWPRVPFHHPTTPRSTATACSPSTTRPTPALTSTGPPSAPTHHDASCVASPEALELRPPIEVQPASDVAMIAVAMTLRGNIRPWHPPH